MAAKKGRDSGISPDNPDSIEIDRSSPISEEQEDNRVMAPVNISGAQLSLVSTFNGEVTEDVQNWILGFDGIAKAFSWPEDNLGLLAQTKFQGKAAVWLRGQRALGYEYAEWDVLKKALLARFKLEVTEVAATNAIHELRQGPKESVDEFYDRVLIALEQKNHRVPEDAKRSQIWRDQFKADIYTFFGAGLKKYIRDATLSAPNPPLLAGDLLKAARLVETSSKSQVMSELTTTPQKEAAPLQEDEKMEQMINAMQKVFGQNSRGGNRGNNRGGRGNFSPSNLTCWRCNKVGHLQQDCRVNLDAYADPGYYRGRGLGRGFRGQERGNYRGGVNPNRGAISQRSRSRPPSSRGGPSRASSWSLGNANCCLLYTSPSPRD